MFQEDTLRQDRMPKNREGEGGRETPAYHRRVEKEGSIQGYSERSRWLLILPVYKTGSGGASNQVTGGGESRRNMESRDQGAAGASSVPP